MLICEYKCEECGREFERMRPLDEAEEVACPRCGNLSVTITATIAASCSGGCSAPSGRLS